MIEIVDASEWGGVRTGRYRLRFPRLLLLADGAPSQPISSVRIPSNTYERRKRCFDNQSQNNDSRPKVTQIT